MNLLILSAIVLAFIAAWVLAIRYRPGHLLPLIVVSVILLAVAGINWLSFGYGSRA